MPTDTQFMDFLPLLSKAEKLEQEISSGNILICYFYMCQE